MYLESSLPFYYQLSVENKCDLDINKIIYDVIINFIINKIHNEHIINSRMAALSY